MSQWGKTQVPQILNRSVQIVQKHAQLGYCLWCRCNFANVTRRKVIWGHIMTSQGQWTFLLVTFDWIEIGTWDRCQMVPLFKVHQMICNMTYLGQLLTFACGKKKMKSTSIFDLRSRSKVDLGRSCCTSFDAPWREEPFGTCPMSLSQSNQKLQAKTSIELVTSLYDLKWPFLGSHWQSCTEVINSSLIEHVSQQIAQIW